MLKKAPAKLEIEEIDIEPHLAESWLTKNVKNRNLTDRIAKKYARDMASGKWKTTGDPIRFDVDGNLIDGQHRLQACVLAGGRIPISGRLRPRQRCPGHY